MPAGSPREWRPVVDRTDFVVDTVPKPKLTAVSGASPLDLLGLDPVGCSGRWTVGM